MSSKDMYSPYWNPKMELASRETIEKWQLYKFQQTLSFAYANSQLWKRKLDDAGVHPEQIKTLADIQKVPFLTKKEYLDSQEAEPMFGDIFATSMDHVMNYHQTSGTSGRTPLRVTDGRRDWSWMVDVWAEGLWALGVRPNDVAYIAFSYGPFIGFWIAHYAFEKIGAMTIPGGGQSSEARIRQILDLDVTAVVATPTYALRLGQTAREMGIDMAKESKVRFTVHAGEPGASIPATKQLMESMWGATCGDFGGMSECGANFYYDCGHGSGGVHIHEDHFLEEVIDPITTKPVPLGQRGELVITPFGRRSLPAIRYRTGDLVERIPASSCTCGRTFDLYKGAIIGRADDMKVIRGVNVYPSAVENIIRRRSEVDEFQIVLSRKGFQDEISVNLDFAPSIADSRYSELVNQIGEELADAHEGLRFNVVAVEAGSLPRFELKSRRLIDQR